MPRRGFFIVLEGPDKSGKSTQANLLVKNLKRLGFPVVHTREPGGTSFAEEIRRILLSPKHRVVALAELLLYEAARAQHTEEKIRPALAAGKIVVCERYVLSTMVYQGYARGLDLKTVSSLNKIATGGLAPGLTLVLDVPESEFAKRDLKRDLDRIEKEPGIFRRRVREGYRKLSRGAVLLDGRRGADELEAEILSRVTKSALVRASVAR